MPIFIAAIGGMLINIVGTLVGRVLIALGIGVGTFTGLQTSLNWLKDNAIDAIFSLPPDVYNMLSLMKIGICINIITSAIIIRWVLNGLSGDALKRWIFSQI